MLDNKLHVLSIDDDQLIHNIIRKTLKDSFYLSTASSGEEGINLAFEVNPDVILLDVEMPKMNGYETCDRLKHESGTKNIPVLFLSSLSDDRSRMLGYEVGAADYLVKPFTEKELITKLDTIREQIEEKLALSKKAQLATDTAYTAMKSFSEMGTSVAFIERSFSAKNIDELAGYFFDSIDGLALMCTLMFIDHSNLYFFCSGNKPVAPLEKEVMTTIHSRAVRFTDFGCRTQISYPHVALLIKNMPLDDMDSYGRYKDLVSTMLSSAEAKFINIQMENALLEQTQKLTGSFEIVQSTLKNIGENIDQNQEDVEKILQNMIAELESRIPGLGLDDDQEHYLISTLETSIKEAQEVIEKSSETKLAFSTVTRLLEHLVIKQNALMTELYESEDEKEFDDSKDSSSSAGDVDLF